MQEEKNNTPKLQPAEIKKAVEINIENGKVHIVTALEKDSLLQVLSLAMFEATKRGN